MFIIMLGMFLIQAIISGIIFGFDKISTPTVLYNYNTNALTEVGLFTGVLVKALSVLPMFILIVTLAFALSTIFSNAAVAIALPIAGILLGAQMLNLIAIQFQITFMKYWVTLNWDFPLYMNGKLNPYEGLQALPSAISCLVYLGIMLVVSFAVFNKRDVKND
jgi:ABC-2 type transport system permease protein